MIVTVNPNTAIDRTLFVPSFALNRTIRATRSVIGMGGKAADASWILGELGVPSRASGFAAGLAGQQMVEMLRQRGVSPEFVWVAGETRVNTLIVAEDGSGQSTITVNTLVVDAGDVHKLTAWYRAALQTATCVVLGGSLPDGVEPDLYTEYIRMARQKGIPVVFDASGPGLLAGLKAQPDFVKPNRAELEEITGQAVHSIDEAYHAAHRLVEQSGAAVIVTMGAGGALAVLPDRVYRIPSPKVRIVSAAGAGDAVLAGLAWALSSQRPVEEGLRLGFAAAGAVMLTPGTADCRRADVERLLPTIELIPYHPPGSV